jgi:hypothetical protein
MTTHVLHTTLLYRHSPLSDERLNVAVLVIFPESGTIKLLRPSKSDIKRRINGFYKDFPIELLTQYLNSFESKAKRISGKLKSYLGNYEHLISDHFLTENGTALYFSNLQSSPVWKDESQTLVWLYRQLLAGYDRDESKTEKFITDSFVANRMKNLIKDAFTKRKNQDYQLYFKEETRVISSGVFHFNSTGFWKNGTVNLLHPLSLDVKTVDGILSKCFVISKSAELLQQKALDENVNFHLLLAKPHLKELQSAYEDSVGVLENTDAPITVVKPENQTAYAERVVQKAISLS